MIRDVTTGDVLVRFTKWGGDQHWTLRGHRLGEDGHGVWVAAPIGTEMTRPGVAFATVPLWPGDEVTMVDLDLDVILFRDGTVKVEDEHEFAEHRVSLGYPPEVVTLARESCAARLAEVLGGVAPYGDVGAAWLRRTVESFDR